MNYQSGQYTVIDKDFVLMFYQSNKVKSFLLSLQMNIYGLYFSFLFTLIFFIFYYGRFFLNLIFSSDFQNEIISKDDNSFALLVPVVIDQNVTEPKCACFSPQGKVNVNP
jgi:hypothetical protein